MLSRRKLQIASGKIQNNAINDLKFQANKRVSYDYQINKLQVLSLKSYVTTINISLECRYVNSIFQDFEICISLIQYSSKISNLVSFAAFQILQSSRNRNHRANTFQRNVCLQMIASDGMWYYSEEHQLRILHENHGSTIDSHSLENKTYNKIREHFY